MSGLGLSFAMDTGPDGLSSVGGVISSRVKGGIGKGFGAAFGEGLNHTYTFGLPSIREMFSLEALMTRIAAEQEASARGCTP
jgi:hypothetical protein